MPDVKFSNLYPYTDFHELNLDWVIKEVKYWSTKVGKTIQSIDLTGSSGLVDTYTITYSDGTTSTFDVTNGNGIVSIAKTGTAGNVDTYTITTSDGSSYPFTVTNGSVTSVNNNTGDVFTAPLSLANTGNLCLTSKMVKNAYWDRQQYPSTSYSYFIFQVTAGQSYKSNRLIRFCYDSNDHSYGEAIVAGTAITPLVTGPLYVTFYNSVVNVSFYNASTTIDEAGTTDTPAFNPSVLKTDIGESKTHPMNQNATTKWIKWARYPDHVLNHHNILIDSEYIDNKYWAGFEDNNPAYGYFKVYVTAGETYQCNKIVRFWYDESGSMGENVPANTPKTATNTGYWYISIAKPNGNAALFDPVYSGEDVGSYNYPSFDSQVLAQSTGTSETKPMSQKATTDALTAISTSLGQLWPGGFNSGSASLNDGQTITLPIQNVKRNVEIAFTADITTFGSILIGHGTTEYSSAYMAVTTTNADITNQYSTASTVQHTHGLTISRYIKILISVKAGGRADITIFSNGSSYNMTSIEWAGDSNANVFVKSVNSSLSNCKLTWFSKNCLNDMWAFGDSYFGLDDPARWMYYAVTAGYDKLLINGFGGENSTAASTALNNLISIGKPKVIIWAMGMNDGSDSGAPASNWLTKIQNFIATCETLNITPILCTIPTVPSINHEYKNAWVRASGHRYIDFAKAVGAQADGTWFSGMLSSDNVHPTTTGAKALYYQAMVDAPEISM